MRSTLFEHSYPRLDQTAMHADLLTSLERFTKEMEAVDELAHVLLKGHLLLEEALSAILEQYVFHREHLSGARLTFAQKVHLAQSLCLRKNTFGEWDLIAAINSLRNDLAHKLNSPDRGKKLARVRDLYFREAALHPEIETIKKGSDTAILFNACGHCAGFLATFLADSRAFRQMIFDMDRSLNATEAPFEI